MIDQNSQFFAILTNVGVAKQANADALGTPWKLAQMGVGDANGADPQPSATQTKLINEWRRAPLNQLKVDPTNSAIIIAEQVIPADVGGKWIREIALYDSDGDLVAVANCAPTFKPLLSQGSGRTQVIRINLQVSNTSNVELKIDPSVVLATRSYVDQKVLDELNKLDFKFSVVAATTASVALNGLQSADGVPGVEGLRTLVWKQAQPKDNGIYLMSAGPWTRAPDADSSLEVTPGLFVHVEKGTLYGDSVFQLVTDAPIVLGTTDLVFESPIGRTGVGAGTYRSVTVDKYGRVVGGTNPTTLAGYGIDPPSQAEAEATTAQDNTKPSTMLRVWQAIAKQFTLFFQTGLTDATIGKGMLVGAGGLMGPVEPFSDANAIPWRTGHFGASGAQIYNFPAGGFARSGDQVFQEVFNSNAAAQHWTCWQYNHKYTRRWQVNAWTEWDEDLTVSSVNALMNATQTQANSGTDNVKYITSLTLSGAISALVIQATEAIKGIAKVATQAQTNSGVDDTTMVTPKKFAAGITALVIQATEVIAGIAKVATQALTNAGADDATFVTPKKLRFGFLFSFNANGYVVFPQWLGSWVIQWVSSVSVAAGSAGSASWPMAFPNACLNAFAMPIGSSANTQAGNVVRGVVSTTGINLYNWGPIAAPACIFAIGA